MEWLAESLPRENRNFNGMRHPTLQTLRRTPQEQRTMNAKVLRQKPTWSIQGMRGRPVVSAGQRQ